MSKVLDNTHQYCSSSNSSKDDDKNVDYVSSQNATYLTNKLNDHQNFLVNPLTEYDRGADKFNQGFTNLYLSQLLDMSYDKNNVYPTYYDPSTISTLHEIVKDTHCFIEAQRQFGEKD